jgi:hypothetical protein
MADPVSDYCDYLDKEMTIMGLLTAFAVAVPSLVLDHVAGAKPSEQPTMYEMWQTEQVMLAVGSLVFFLSALCFYLQRSALAYYLGQLRLSLTAAYYQTMSTEQWLVCADYWSAWRSYNVAFALLILGFVLYGCALFAPNLAALRPHTLIAALTSLALIYIGVNHYVKTTYRDEDHPWCSFFSTLRHKSDTAGLFEGG